MEVENIILAVNQAILGDTNSPVPIVTDLLEHASTIWTEPTSLLAY